MIRIEVLFEVSFNYSSIKKAILFALMYSMQEAENLKISDLANLISSVPEALKQYLEGSVFNLLLLK